MPIPPARPRSVTWQLNQGSTAKSMQQSVTWTGHGACWCRWGKAKSKRCVLRHFLKVAPEVAEWTHSGRLFQREGAQEWNALAPYGLFNYHSDDQRNVMCIVLSMPQLRRLLTCNVHCCVKVLLTYCSCHIQYVCTQFIFRNGIYRNKIFRVFLLWVHRISDSYSVCRKTRSSGFTGQS